WRISMKECQWVSPPSPSYLATATGAWRSKVFGAIRHFQFWVRVIRFGSSHRRRRPGRPLGSWSYSHVTKKSSLTMYWDTGSSRADPGLNPREHLVGTTEVAVGWDQQPTERVMGPHVVVPAQVRREPLRHLIDVEEAVLVEQLLVQVAVEAL